MRKSNVRCSTTDTIILTTTGLLVLSYQENFLISFSIVIADSVICVICFTARAFFSKQDCH